MSSVLSKIFSLKFSACFSSFLLDIKCKIFDLLQSELGLQFSLRYLLWNLAEFSRLWRQFFLNFWDKIRIDFTFAEFSRLLRWTQNMLWRRFFLDFCNKIRIDSFRGFSSLKSAFLDICDKITIGFPFCRVFKTPEMWMDYALAKLFLISAMKSE